MKTKMPDDKTRKILEARARTLAVKPAEKPSSDAVIDLLTFHLGGEFLGVPTSAVHETQPLHNHQWTRVPCTPAFIVGIINLRGRILSITDLAIFMGLSDHPVSERAHVLLVRRNDDIINKKMELVLLTDDPPEMRQVPVTDLNMPPPNLPLQTYIRGVTPDLLVVLDLQSLLLDPRLVVNEFIS